MTAARKRTRKGRIDAELTSLVGRHAEIAEVRQLVAEHRLVTVTGVGGVGKTRLALRVAGELGRAYTDGVWQADLAAIRDPRLLAYALAQALDITDQTDRPVSEVLIDHLRDSEVLLVVDNCEHLLDACAEMLGALLLAAPGVRVLATSRQPLGVAGEQVWRVPPLPVPEPDRVVAVADAARYPALVLFVERAAAARPGFALTPQNAALVARICRSLDGLPLAIELAAPWLRTMSLEQLSDGLGDRLLLRTRYASPAHQRTLQAAFDWSHALCTGVEQDLWASLAVFADSFDLAAAEAVCGAGTLDGRVPEGLAGLVEKSVLAVLDGPDGARFRLLETVREYGLTQLRDAPGAEDVRRRAHRDYYLRLTVDGEQGWSGPDQEGTYRAMRREYGNLRAALDYSLHTPGEARTGLALAGTLWFYWTGYGFLSEGRYWLDGFLALNPTPSPERTRALWAAGAVAVGQGDLDGMARMLAECREHAAQTGDEWILGLAGLSLGTAALFSGDYPSAEELFEQALARFDGAGMVAPSTLMGRSELAMVVALRGDLDRADAICRDTLEICGRRNDRWASGWVYYVLTLTALARGDVGAAIEHARRGLRVMSVFHNLTGVAMLTELYVPALLAAGAAERAAVLHGAAEQMWQAMGRRLFGSAALDEQHRQAEEHLRSVLGDAGYQAAHRRGTYLSVEEAVGYAVEPEAGGATDRGPGRAPAEPAGLESLTAREREVAELVGSGLSNREIAARIYTSPRTVETHVENILRKLGFTSRVQVAVWIVDDGEPADSRPGRPG